MWFSWFISRYLIEILNFNKFLKFTNYKIFNSFYIYLKLKELNLLYSWLYFVQSFNHLIIGKLSTFFIFIKFLKLIYVVNHRSYKSSDVNELYYVLYKHRFFSLFNSKYLLQLQKLNKTLLNHIC